MSRRNLALIFVISRNKWIEQEHSVVLRDLVSFGRNSSAGWPAVLRHAAAGGLRRLEPLRLVSGGCSFCLLVGTCKWEPAICALVTMCGRRACPYGHRRPIQSQHPLCQLHPRPESACRTTVSAPQSSVVRGRPRGQKAGAGHGAPGLEHCGCSWGLCGDRNCTRSLQTPLNSACCCWSERRCSGHRLRSDARSTWQATPESRRGTAIGSAKNQEIKLAGNNCCFGHNIRMMHRIFKLQPSITCISKNLNDTTSAF